MYSIEKFSYLPILALSPAEMAALEELPEKDKSLILPLISLKGWVGSNKLKSSVERLVKAIGNRPWIADIDKDYIESCQSKVALGAAERPVFKELEELISSENGYENWVNFLKSKEFAIPTLQLGDLSQIEAQIDGLESLGRGIVVRFSMQKNKMVTPEVFNTTIRMLVEKKVFDVTVILDCGDVSRSEVLEADKYSQLLKRLYSFIPTAYFSVSSTSFPYSFIGSYRGELPIYERQIHEEVVKSCPNINTIYSDRGSARANQLGGGGGIIPVRIDYPLKNDWRFVRKELDKGQEKEKLYQQAAIEIMQCDFWEPSLSLWGTQMIELTSLGDPYGINSASKATSVRINIHLYQQLHYYENIDELDTEEEWVD